MNDTVNLPSLGEEGGRLFGHLGTAIELDDLAGHNCREGAEDRQYRREWKRGRKLHQLLQEEEMKFSHSIQFNAVPDWSSKYISYSNLKKL